MRRSPPLDSLFHDAVAAIDDGDVGELKAILAAHPQLVRERLDSPGPWLSDKVGKALGGFFKRPYLLWFVAEDPVRNGKLPRNIAAVARTIIEAARRESVPDLQEQLDYALTLVSWSGISAECGVQIELIDVLIDAGANPDGNPNNALVNGHFAAAEHLLKRGARLTLATALCLDRWDEVDALLPTTSPRKRQFALVLAALNGKSEALRRMTRAGSDVNARSEDLYAHGTPLHHAVCSGSLEAVEALVEAGADRSVKDSAWDGTPLDWAEYYLRDENAHGAGKQYAEIANYLRGQAKHS